MALADIDPTTDAPGFSLPLARRALPRETWVALDGLRGVSILLVVIVHFWAHAASEGTGVPVKLFLGDLTFDMTWIFATGSNGVSTFFALSGFLLYRHWLESEPTSNLSMAVTQFYRRRLQRVMPAYAFFTCLYLLLVVLIGKHHFGADVTPANILLNITFLSPLAVWFGSHGASSLDIVPGTWSLNPEMWFYLAMPAFAILLRRLPARWLVILALSFIAPAYRASLGADASFVLRFSLPGVLDAFLFGMAVAVMSANGWIGKAAGLLFPLGAAWYIACCASVTPLRFDWASQVPAASALMIAGLIAPGNWPWKRWLAGSAIVRIGRISYSMFLCNTLVVWYIILPIWHLCGLESSGSRFVMNLIVGFPILYFVSLASFNCIEAPFMSRERVNLNLTLRRATAIATVVLALSLIPAAIGEIVRDEGSAEYAGPAIKLARRLFISPMVGGGTQPVNMAGTAVVASETGHTSVQIEQIRPDQIRISSSGLDQDNHWIAVMLPVELDAVVRGRMVSMTARLSIVHPTDAEACLGIYNGSRDVCSARRPMQSDDVLSVETSTVRQGPLQFKFNIFPERNAGPFEVTLNDIRIDQTRR